MRPLGPKRLLFYLLLDGSIGKVDDAENSAAVAAVAALRALRVGFAISSTKRCLKSFAKCLQNDVLFLHSFGGGRKFRALDVVNDCEARISLAIS